MVKHVVDLMSILNGYLMGILRRLWIACDYLVEIDELSIEWCIYINTLCDESSWPHFSNVETSYIYTCLMLITIFTDPVLYYVELYN